MYAQRDVNDDVVSTHSHVFTSAPTATAAAAAAVTAAHDGISSSSNDSSEDSHRRHVSSLSPWCAPVHVAQSATTARNPFRTQEYAEFCVCPSYAPPADVPTYRDMLTATTVLDGTVTPVVCSGEVIARRIRAATTTTAAATTTQPGEATWSQSTAHAVRAVQAGAWWYKATSAQRVHRRYVWLNVRAGALTWSRAPPQHGQLQRVLYYALLRTSTLVLTEVTSMTTECVRDATTRRTIYQIVLYSPTRQLCLTSEQRDKYDVWCVVLQLLTSSNACHSIPGLHVRPSRRVDGATSSGAVSRWATRYSPLQAIVDGSDAHGSTRTPPPPQQRLHLCD